MSDTKSLPTGGEQPAATNTGLANAFMNNGPSQVYNPAPASAPSFASLSGPGSLPGLTGSLIGSNAMPPLPRPSGPMPLPQPVAPVAAAPIKAAPHQLWGQFNVRSDGTSSFGGTPGNVTGGTKLTDAQKKTQKYMGGPLYSGGR